MDYLQTHYAADLSKFCGAEVPPHGPFFMLCGRTLGNLFEPGQAEKYADPEAFLCSVYFLNLISLGIHRYFDDEYESWNARCAAFPDVRGCPERHGGIETPGSILLFAQDPSYVPNAKRIVLRTPMLQAHAAFFFGTYIPVVCRDHGFHAITATSLAEKLLDDSDCPEFGKYYAL